MTGVGYSLACNNPAIIFNLHPSFPASAICRTFSRFFRSPLISTLHMRALNYRCRADYCLLNIYRLHFYTYNQSGEVTLIVPFCSHVEIIACTRSADTQPRSTTSLKILFIADRYIHASQADRISLRTRFTKDTNRQMETWKSTESIESWNTS
jgi:hypothetical protein